MPLSGLDEYYLGNNYYELLPRERAIEHLSRQIYYTPIIYPFSYPKILVPSSSYDPRETSEAVFEIKHFSHDDPRKTAIIKDHFPMKRFDLRSDELPFVYKGKLRKVVVLGRVYSTWVDEDTPEEILLCAPFFSFLEHHDSRYAVGTQAFEYPNLFYVPDDSKADMTEGVIRLETIQAVSTHCLRPHLDLDKESLVALSEKAFWLLIHCFVNFTTGKPLEMEIAENLEAWRELLLEEYEKIEK